MIVKFSSNVQGTFCKDGSPALLSVSANHALIGSIMQLSDLTYEVTLHTVDGTTVRSPHIPTLNEAKLWVINRLKALDFGQRGRDEDTEWEDDQDRPG